MSNPKQFLTALTIAIANCSLYAKDNELIDEAGKKAFSILNELIEGRVEMMVIDDDLIINKSPVRDSRLHTAKLLKLFKHKGISRIEFLKGITAEELKQFIINLSKPDEEMETSPHIKAGIVAINGGGSGTGATGAAVVSSEDIPDFREEQIEKLKGVFHSISPVFLFRPTTYCTSWPSQHRIRRSPANAGEPPLPCVGPYSSFLVVHTMSPSVVRQAVPVGPKCT